MDKRLTIVPVGTELSWRECSELANGIIPIFLCQYAEKGVRWYPDLDTTYNNDVRVTLNEGVLKDLSHRLENEHAVVVTDRDINLSIPMCGSYNPLGWADKIRGTTAIVSRARLPKSGSEIDLQRIVKMALHELGHLHGLPHHELTASSVKYCPMTENNNLASQDPERIGEFLDTYANSFCVSCSKTLASRAN